MSTPLALALCLLSTVDPTARPGGELVPYAAPWTSPYRVSAHHPHHLVNVEGRYLFPLVKTAWHYFGAKDPQISLDRAKRIGANVLRVALEGRLYHRALGIDLWPWGGSRDAPDFARFDERYWRTVEERIALAGRQGIGFDVVLYTSLRPEDGDVEAHRAYWREVLRRLGRHANVLTWELHNEHVENEAFQDAAGAFLAESDPFRRPVITSNGTRDVPTWPHKRWMGMAVTHTCTSSTAAHGLRDWYLAVARNARGFGKPSLNNETGRERRHRNDDGVHRRKQAWLWTMAGGFWTWHSWDGCEGIDDARYRAPGEEFLRAVADFHRALPFWTLNPDHTAVVIDVPDAASATMATADRALAVAYVGSEQTGRTVDGAVARLRLREGDYDVRFVDPTTGRARGVARVEGRGLGTPLALPLPPFRDDLVVHLQRTADRREREMADTR